MNNQNWVSVIIVLAILVFAYFVITRDKTQVTEEVAQCIGQKSTLYVQLGCTHCKTQEEMFGDYYQYLTFIDCVYEREKCSDIEGTPTWKINGINYKGIQSIEKLRELTGC